MSTVTVTPGATATVNDGTAATLVVRNTGAFAAFVAPWQRKLRPGERAELTPEGQAVTATSQDGTTTLDVTATAPVTTDVAHEAANAVQLVETRPVDLSGAALTLGDTVIKGVTGTPSSYPIGPTGADNTGINVLSSFAGGEDDGTGTDSTGRINLYSYQRASSKSLGEVLRIFAMRQDSKQMIAWYGAQQPSSQVDGYDNTTRDVTPGSSWKPWAWMGAHYEANDHASVHGHWSLEVPDSTGALQTRFEVQFADRTTGAIGLDKTFVLTNAADFVVRCSNGQVLRLSAAAGTEKALEINNDAYGSSSSIRWKVRGTNEAEAGSDAGTNFTLARYNDAGTFQDNPIFVSRATGNVNLGPGFIARRSTSSVSTLSLNTSSLGSGQGVIAIGNASTLPSGTPSGGGVLYVEGGALKFKGSSGTVTTIAPA